jgi:hypothetical protein
VFKVRLLVSLLLGVVACLPGLARASDPFEAGLATLWESLWHQSGIPTRVVRWEGDVRVRLAGVQVSAHRDTVMQALSFIDKRPAPGPGEAGKASAPKKMMPRRPTDNQTRTKYSKANLAWIVKTGAKQDARFRKDLARYYRDIDELKNEFKM